jgi:hypothetical protein
MPIRINLLAEAQAAEEMRRKDPVKRSIWIAGFIVFLVLLAALTLQLKISRVRSDIAALDIKWKSIESAVKQVESNRRNTRDIESKLLAIDQFTTNRMLWANALDALQHATVENIQVARLKTEQIFIINEGAKPKTNDTGIVTPGKPSTTTERIVVTIDGKDYSARQGDKVPQFKDALLKSPYFVAMLQKTNKAQLTSMTPPQLEGARSFVGFGLQLFYEDKERRLNE